MPEKQPESGKSHAKRVNLVGEITLLLKQFLSQRHVQI
jgi:hypothetical protein